MQWQYHIVTIDTLGFMGISPGAYDAASLQHHMNVLGSDGWELASTFPADAGNGGTRSINLIFKRPIRRVIPTKHPTPPPNPSAPR